LIDHEGQQVEDAGWFWGHAKQRYKIAHDLFANFVADSGKHYPLKFRWFKKREQCEVTGEMFDDHGVLFRQLVDWVGEREIPGDFTFDSYFSSTENLNHFLEQHCQSRAYVADLTANRKLEVRGRSLRTDEFAGSILRENRQELRHRNACQWYYSTTVRLPQLRHLLRIVFIWNNRRDSKLAKVLIRNCTRWEVNRIIKRYRYRWTGTDTFHRDGKHELGRGACQLRSGQGQTKPMRLVMVAYTILVREHKSGRAKGWGWRGSRQLVKSVEPSLTKRCGPPSAEPSLKSPKNLNNYFTLSPNGA
jgi:hypothetical protein